MPERTSHDPGTPSWVDVASPDVDAAIDFYTRLFGWEASEAGDPEETGGYRMFFQGGKAVAGAGPIQNEGQPPVWTTYVTVADADQAVERVKGAGGGVLMEPIDVMTAGRMAILTDPAGAAFAIWQPNEHIGSELVNEPVSLCWNELRTNDVEGAKSFYGDVFGWGTVGFEAMEGYTVWTLGGDAPENGRGGLMDIEAANMDGVPPHWGIAFAVADTDATAAKAAELGGTVVMDPFDSPVGRIAVLTDPAGAGFQVIELAQQPPQ